MLEFSALDVVAFPSADSFSSIIVGVAFCIPSVEGGNAWDDEADWSGTSEFCPKIDGRKSCW
mgnify:CR=1 FL=1